MSVIDPRQRLIVALDQSPDRNRALVDTLGDTVVFYKVGPIALLSAGRDVVIDLLGLGKRIFLDMKVFDVPNTVGNTVKAVAELGASFVTVHGNRPVIEAAVKARGDSDLKILAVTALTSLSAGDVQQLYGIPDRVSLREHVVRAAEWLIEIGCDGVISSPEEVATLRDRVTGVADAMLIVAPGIRMPGDSTDDQVRIGGPYDSIRAGADYLVVGRSIANDPDPRQKAKRYVDEIGRGLAEREV